MVVTAGFAMSVLGFALMAAPASAVPVTITYSITPGGNLNTTSVLGGAAPTGGTAAVRWSMTSTNGAFINGGQGTLLSLKLTHTAFGTVSFQPFVDTSVPVAGLGNPQLRPPSTLTWPTVPTGFSLPLFVSTFINLQHLPLSPPTVFSFFFRRTNNFGSYFTTIAATGVEVARVPEPASAPLAGLGLLALGGFAARRQVRRRSIRA
jgi:MYXO-CTERM domain-containing protein